MQRVRLLITHVGSASGVFSKLGVVLGGLSGTGRSRGVVLDTLLGLFMSFPMCSPATGAAHGKR